MEIDSGCRLAALLGSRCGLLLRTGVSGWAGETPLPLRVPATGVSSLHGVHWGEAVKGQRGACCPGVCSKDVGSGRREGPGWEAMKIPSLQCHALESDSGFSSSVTKQSFGVPRCLGVGSKLAAVTEGLAE